MMRLRIAAAVAAAAAIAGLSVPAAQATTAAHAAPRAAANISGMLRESHGQGLPILQQPHGSQVLVVTGEPGSTVTYVDDGNTANFEIRTPNGLCLTANQGDNDAVTEESCNMSSKATLWHLGNPPYIIVNNLLQSLGITGNLTASPAVSCQSTDVVFAEGGLPASDCHVEFVI